LLRDALQLGLSLPERHARLQAPEDREEREVARRLVRVIEL
jgi:hypothetical protein